MIKSNTQRFGRGLKRQPSQAKTRTSGSRRYSETGAVEEQIRLKLASYKAIQQVDEAWSTAVRLEKVEFNRGMARQIQTMYEDWMKGTDGIIRKMKALEARGQAVARSEEFRDTVGYCPAGIDANETLETLRRLENGEGIVVHEAVINGKIQGRRRS